MTEKLYYKAPYLSAFDAEIVQVTHFHGKSAVVLDRTAFFPEGGGQPGDVGLIGETKVVDTQMEDGVIYHCISGETPLCCGAQVHCVLDWETRFARMQAHSGEHVVSGIAHRLFGVNNVGFHMDDTLMTVDFDRLLSKEDLELVEREANRIVYRDLPIRAWYPDASTLETLEYRSKTEIREAVRIVTIEDCDDCACCAVHVKSTGAIGLIKILASVSHRGGVRLTLICGKTAYEDYRMKHAHTLRIADLLAAKHSETAAAVEKLMEKEKALHLELRRKTDQLLAFIAQNTEYSNENLVFAMPDFTPEELKTAAIRLKDCCGGLCVVLSETEGKGYYFAIASASVNVTDFTKQITSALHGNGGGRYEVIQGRFNASLAEIKQYFMSFTVK